MEFNKDIFLLGIQWCGKWTQAELLLKKLTNHKYYEMWETLRAFHSNDNLIGNYIKDRMNRGIMIDDFITFCLIDAALGIVEVNKQNILVDGFPRLKDQADYIMDKMNKMNRNYVVIHFVLSKEKALERMVSRAQKEARKDDNPEAMKTRIEVFQKETLPILENFKKLWKLIEINADDTIENIFQETLNKLQIINNT